MPEVSGIDTLLDLDGLIIAQVAGYWVKLEVDKIFKALGLEEE